MNFENFQDACIKVERKCCVTDIQYIASIRQTSTKKHPNFTELHDIPDLYLKFTGFANFKVFFSVF